MRMLFGLFIVLHGLVHLLYLGQSARLFEMQPGMSWPDGSWALSVFLGNASIRNLANASLVAAALGFIAAGAGLFAQQDWWQSAVIGAAVFSSGIYILFWDGVLQSLDDKGGVGILINLAILVALLVFRWPAFDF